MRRKRSTRKDVLIDLTSLLDVIFIILLIVLCGQRGLDVDLNESLRAAADARTEAEAARDIYTDMIDTADNINQFVYTASISVPYNKAEVTKREIKVLVEGQEIRTFELNGLDTQESMAQFKNLLIEYISRNKDRPVILSLNDGDDRILYRDERSIMELLEKLSADYSNVYIKNMLNEDHL